LQYASGVKISPMMNDSWWAICNKIRQVTPPNALIDMWWDEGDFIMTVAKRATLHDASLQFTPTPYWMARVFLSNNELEALGILRMLNSGSNQAFDKLSSALKGDKLLALELINKMFLLDYSDGRSLLENYIKDKPAVENILKLMYGPPPPAYLVVSDETVRIMNILRTVLNWDFNRFYLWEKFLHSDENGFFDYAQKQLKFSSKEAEAAYAALQFADKKDALGWVSHEPHKFYISNSKSSVPVPGSDTLLFDNGVSFDRKAMRAYYRNDFSHKWNIIAKVIFVSEGRVEENYEEEGDKDCALLVTKENDTYKAVLLGAPITESLFFKLYFLEGRGLKYFKPIAHEFKEGYSNVFLYQIDWAGAIKE